MLRSILYNYSYLGILLLDLSQFQIIQNHNLVNIVAYNRHHMNFSANNLPDDYIIGMLTKSLIGHLQRETRVNYDHSLLLVLRREKSKKASTRVS